MFIAKELIAKGLLATAATATAITLGVVYGDNIAKYMSSEDEGKLIGEVGLECNATTNVCTLKSGVTTLNIKQGSSGEITTVNNLSAQAFSGTGRIKKIKLEGTNTYNKNLKFSIENANIPLPTSTSPQVTLEEFETYEIKDDGTEANKKYYLSRVTDVNTEIKKALGLPEDCVIPSAVGAVTNDGCDISGDKFKNIKFEGLVKTEASVSGTPKLKISKVEDTNNDYGNYKLKFVLESNALATIATGNVIKENTNTEFKIKVSNAAGSQGPRTLSLEKAWTVAKLAEKIGVAASSGCTAETETAKECTLPTTISVFNDTGNYVVGATVTGGSTHKLTFLTEQPDYNQGYKFTSASEIALTVGSGTKVGEVNNIEANGDGYEIKEQLEGTAKK